MLARANIVMYIKLIKFSSAFCNYNKYNLCLCDREKSVLTIAGILIYIVSYYKIQYRKRRRKKYSNENQRFKLWKDDVFVDQITNAA